MTEPAAATAGQIKPSPLSLVFELRRKGMLATHLDLWRRHFDLTRVELGPASYFLVVHPRHVRQIAVGSRHKYDKVKSYQAARDLLFGRGMLTALGEDWRWQRQLLAPLFTPRAVEPFVGAMAAETRRYAQRWQELSKRGPIDMVDEMKGLASSIILNLFFAAPPDTGLVDLRRAAGDMVGYVVDRQASALNLPLWLRTPGNLRYRRAYRVVNQYARGLIERRRALPQADWPEDLLSALLRAHDPATGEPIDEKLLVDNCMNFFLAGYETTALTLSFLWYALSKHPDVEARLHAEVDALPDPSTPSIADVRRLPYTLQVIKEVMRLYPVTPLYARDAIEDDNLDGTPVPAGSRLVLFPFATHRHPAYWRDPETFDPDRFTPEAEAARDPYAYHPFAAGNRICVGNHLSILEAVVITAMLARRFTARTAPGYELSIEAHGILELRGGLPMLLRTREAARS